MQCRRNRRVLVVDDNPSIHEDFLKILCGSRPVSPSLAEKEAVLFGQVQRVHLDAGFEVDSAHQGEEGWRMITEARQAGRPYAMAFVDIRMPPGWDGITTIERIWPTDPDIQIVVCSAYSDYSAQEMILQLGVSDRLLMLRKPCDPAEILLISMALCEKWNLAAGWVPASRQEISHDAALLTQGGDQR